MAFRHHVHSLNALPRLYRDKFAPHTPFPPGTPVVNPWHPWQPTHSHEASMVARLIGATRQIHLNCRVLIWICLGEPPSINIRVSRSCASSRRDAWPLTASQPAGYSSPPVSAELLASLPHCVRSGEAAATASSLSMAFRHHLIRTAHAISTGSPGRESVAPLAANALA